MFFLSHLPVQCLCEFLLSPSCRQQGKFNQLLNHLKKLLMHPETDPTISCEVLEYFLRRLSSPTSRQHAILVSKNIYCKIKCVSFGYYIITYFYRV